MEQHIANKYTCDVCSYSWVSRLDRPPKVCPRCKRYNYQLKGQLKELEDQLSIFKKEGDDSKESPTDPEQNEKSG